MASIVVNGDTSGAVTLSAPAVAGTVTVTLPATTGTMLTTASSTGISGSAISSGTVAEAYGGTGTSTGYYGFKNRIINGAMVIDQRNAGASVTPADGAYTLDRWQYQASQASKFTVQQNAGSVTPPTGFSNYLGATVASSVSIGSGDYFGLLQRIEGFNFADMAWGTASAATVTLSFWVRSSLTGTFGGVLRNSAQNRSYPFTYTISSANTWEYETITIAGDTSGTWVGGTNGIGLQVWFSLGAGSTYSGTSGAWAGSNFLSATFYITGVQLEKGSTATSFDYRPYGTELALCQRYCVNYNSANASSSYFRYGIGENEGTTVASQILQFPVSMRTGPTLTTTGTAANYAVYSAGSVIACTAIPSIGTTSPLTAQIGWTTAAVLTAGRASSLLANNNNTSYLIFSAEL